MSAQDAYTPDLEQVRDNYTIGQAGWDRSFDFHPESYAEFDRWLALHDAAIRAEAFEQAAKVADYEGHIWSGAPSHALFKVADNIRSLGKEQSND